MSLYDISKKIKSFLTTHTEYLKITIVILAIIDAFGLGIFSTFLDQKSPVIILKNYGEVPSDVVKIEIVASKSGTKYYYPWCSGINRIKPENKVYFTSHTEAINKGYSRAKNCPGR